MIGDRMTNWLVLLPGHQSARHLPAGLVQHYLGLLVKPEDTLGVVVSADEDPWPERTLKTLLGRKAAIGSNGQVDAALAFHDRVSGGLDVLIHRFGATLYGIVYPTGVFMPGARCPVKLGPSIKTGEVDPSDGFEVLVVLVDDTGIVEPWRLETARRWPPLDAAVQWAFASNRGLRSGSAPSIPVDALAWEQIVFLPQDDVRSVEDLIASVNAIHASKVVVLGSLSNEYLEMLDCRFTVLPAP